MIGVPSLKITRTIHPVGQGALYSETFSSDGFGHLLSVVYDCGSSTNSKIIKPIIEKLNSFSILFISHFHDDHTNMVETLLNKNESALVVIPGVNHCRFLVDLILNYLRTRSTTSYSIIFMLRCVAALKNPRTSHKISLQGDLSSKCSTPSGIVALAPSAVLNIEATTYNWCYDAYYNEYDTSKEVELINELSKIIPSIKEIQKDLTEYRDSDWYRHLLVELSALKEAELSNVKEIYSKVFGEKNHNSYSMLVHSHSLNNEIENSDCLYTGDIKITAQVKNAIRELSPHYIQVPHHGSKENHNKDAYRRRQVAFMSVGTSNSYGHPGVHVLMDLLQICPYIHVVTEKYETRFRRSFKIQ